MVIYSSLYVQVVCRYLLSCPSSLGSLTEQSMAKMIQKEIATLIAAGKPVTPWNWSQASFWIRCLPIQKCGSDSPFNFQQSSSKLMTQRFWWLKLTQAPRSKWLILTQFTARGILPILVTQTDGSVNLTTHTCDSAWKSRLNNSTRLKVTFLKWLNQSCTLQHSIRLWNTENQWAPDL